MADASFRLSGLVDRYAGALFSLVEKDKVGKAVGDDLRTLQAMIEASADLRLFLRSPLLSRAAHEKGLSALLDRVGFCDLTRHFLHVVSRHRRLFALSRIITRYFDLELQSRGEMVAHVTSVHPLTRPQTRAIADKLKAATGHDMRIVTHVDPGILGGMIVKVGSRMFDSSLSGKLATLRLVMKGTA